MIEGHEIICFAGNDWWYRNPGSSNHLMTYLAKHNKVIYINSIAMGISVQWNRDFLQRAKGKVRSHLKWIKRINKQLVVMSPITLPIYRFTIIQKLNRLLLSLQIKYCMKLFHIVKPILWISIPTAQIITDIPKEILVYHVHDKHIAQKGIPKDVIKRLHAKLLQASDIVLYSSYKYYGESRGNSSNAYFLDHGVDYQHFSRAMDKNLEIPDDIAGIKRPIVGYFGIGHEDWELVRYLVAERPNWSFVFIGQSQNVKSELKSMSNLFFLGKKMYSEIPHYAKAFDVCILPYKIDEWVEYSNPIKLKEYLSTGKPVVSISFPAVERYKDVVYCARSREEFLSLLDKSIYEDTKEEQQKRINAVKNETWDKIVEQLSDLLVSHIR